MNFIPAIAYHSCLNLPETFSQPGAHFFAHHCNPEMCCGRLGVCKSSRERKGRQRIFHAGFMPLKYFTSLTSLAFAKSILFFTGVRFSSPLPAISSVMNLDLFSRLQNAITSLFLGAANQNAVIKLKCNLTVVPTSLHISFYHTLTT